MAHERYRQATNRRQTDDKRQTDGRAIAYSSLKKLVRRWDSERERFYDDICNHFYTVPLEATEVGEITQNKGHYAVQGHSRSPILVLIERSYTTSYQWLILTYLLPCTSSFREPPICPKSLYLATPLAFNPPDGGPISYYRKWYIAKTRYFGLHFGRRKLQPLLRSALRNLPNSVKQRKIRPITPFKLFKVTDFGTGRKPM